MLENQKKSKYRDLAVFYLFLFLGVFLLAGAITTLISGSWPVYMPMQLDLINLVVGLVGDKIGVYVSAAISGFLGGSLVWLAIYIFKNK